MSRFLQDIWHHMDHMGPRHWFWVLVVAIIVGAVCLRGFGSRSQY
jgi:hypothetical protein